MKSKIILLVEDNPKDELLTKRALSRGLHLEDIVVAHDGQEAIDLLFGANHLESLMPAVVLLDLRLPKLDGHEVLRRIRHDKRTRLLPVVILTSSDEQSDILRGYDEGANSYVRKPVETEAFSEAVKNLGLFWLLTNVPPGNMKSRYEQ
ncbi:MAG: response regulator [Sedimenticola sp.]